jgi:hypothetical protein
LFDAITGAESILVGADGRAARFAKGAPRGIAGLFKPGWTCRKVQVAPGPIVVTGRGCGPMFRTVAKVIRRQLGLLDLPPMDLARRLDRLYRRHAILSPTARKIEVCQLVIAGFRNDKAFLREFHRKDAASGFAPQPAAKYYVAPWDRSIDHLSTPATVDGMVRLLAAQVALSNHHGLPAGPPFEVLTLTPGMVECQTFADLPSPSPRLGGLVVSSAL